jgi:hypothetical protein
METEKSSRVVLNPVEREVVAAIISYRAKHKVSPTYRELAAMVNRSVPATYERVRRLVDRGVINPGEPGRKQQITVNFDKIGVVDADALIERIEATLIKLVTQDASGYRIDALELNNAMAGMGESERLWWSRMRREVRNG